jgi:hypothetical protein
MVNFMREKSSLPICRVLKNLSSDSSVVNYNSLDDIGVWDHCSSLDDIGVWGHRCLPANTPLQFLTTPVFNCYVNVFFLLTTSLYEISFILYNNQAF